MPARDASGPRPSRYEIRLLGPFTVLRDGVPLPDREIGSRKARTLLKRLLAERGEVVSVDVLTEAVWPEGAPAQPERHVATLVSRLRASLGGDVVARAGEGYRFGAHPAYVLDWDEAERLTGEAEARLAAGESGLARSAAGRAQEWLGRGTLLADEPYAEWALRARAQAGALLARARRAAWASALALRDLDAAARAAAAALSAEPFDEDACRALMRAHYGRGEPGLALAAFDRLRTALADELGVDPGKETLELHQAILRAEPATAPAAPGNAERAAPSGSDESAGSDLVGRDAELAWLRTAWWAATEGTAQLVLLIGEAGIGKTRLATEVVRLAEATGGTVARARCYEAERSLFLQPVADALRPVVVTSSPGLLRDAAGTAAGSLATLVPEAGGALQARECEVASPDVERRRVFEAVVQFVRALAERGPVLVFLDDLHLAGSSTLELVHFLLRRLARSRVLVLATARVEEGAEVLDVLGEAARRRDLGPLGDDAVAELARRGGLAELASRITAQTRGHPLFVVETLRALAEEPSGEGSVPESLRTAVSARLRRAGRHVEELLRAAATLGGSFGPELLAGLTGESVEVTARRLDAGCRARLLAEAGAAYEFANDLIQEIAYQTTPLPIRVARHRRAAQLLAGSPEGVAYHAIRAGDWPGALEASLQAADVAARRYANREAERLLEQAIHAAVRAGDRVGTARARLARGRIRETLADYQGAFEDHSAVIELARAENRPHLELAALNQLGGDTLVGLRRPTRDCIPYLESALALAEATGDLPVQVDVLGRLAVIWTNRLRCDLARTYADRAVELAARRQDDTAWTMALDAVKTTLAYTGDIAGLEALLPRLRAHQRRYRQGLLRYRGSGLRAWAVFESAFPALARGRWAEATARIGQALAVIRESGYVAYESPFLAHLAWAERARGRYGAALRQARRAADLAAEIEHPWWVALAETMLGWVLTELGACDEATERLRRGLAAAERDTTEGYLVRCLGHLAWASWLRGDHDEAVALADRAEALLAGATGPVLLHGAHATLAAASVRVATGDTGAADRLLTPVRGAAQAAGWVETTAWADLLSARCRLLDGDPEHAERLAAAALARAEPASLPGITWQAHALLARLRPDATGHHRAAAETIIAKLATSLGDAASSDTFRTAATRQLDDLAGTSEPTRR